MTTGTDPIPYIMDLKEQVGALQQSFSDAERERTEGKTTQREIKSTLQTLNDRMSQIPDLDHRDHHEFIKIFLNERRQSQQLKAAVIQKIATGGAWALISGLVTLLWFGIKHKLGLGG